MTYEDIVKDCHYLILNMNDTFHYASADSEKVDSWDVVKAMPIISKYGREALIAMVSIIRKYDPQIEQNVTENFIKAKDELLAMKVNDKYFMDEYE